MEIEKITLIKGKKKKAYINQSLCDKASFCPVIKICFANAVEKKELSIGEIIINLEKCIGCGKCVAYCPQNAVVMI